MDTQTLPVVERDGTPLAPPSAVIKRDGRIVPYDRSRIAHAIEMAFRAEAKVPYPDPFDASSYEAIERVTDSVELWLATHPLDTAFPIETIQDEVERALMDAGHHAEARRYILTGRGRACVGEEYNRRFEALGAVDRHDADLVAAVIHVALHFRVDVAKLGKELRQ